MKPSSTAGARPRVLVVDDDALIRRPLELILQQHGFEANTVDDGEACLDRLDSERPDLILMDVMMPGRDGFQICRALKSDPAYAAIPVVLLTGRDEPDDVAQGQSAGADGFMTKPYSPTELLSTVRRLLDPNKDGERA